MKRKRWLRIICAVALAVGASSLAHRAAAGACQCSQEDYAVEKTKNEPRILLHGRRLLTVGGYELNASFTPSGEFFSFELIAVGEKSTNEKPKV